MHCLKRSFTNRFGLHCLFAAAWLAVTGCGSSSKKSDNPGTNGGAGNNSGVKPDTTGANILNVTVNGSTCDATKPQGPNQLCGSVTVCQPGTSACQTITNLLIDTGSSGLRVFASALTVTLSPSSAGSGTLAECVQYADGTSEWGTVRSADVKLANEPAVTVPIQVIDASYGAPPPTCTSAQSTPDTSPDELGFNGVLGLGLFDMDCGADCTTDAENGSYYSCTSSSCTPTTSSVQVRNPVALLPTDNNGIILKLGAVGAAGAPSVAGTLLLGIGTQANNAPGKVTTYATDAAGNFTTLFGAFKATPITGFLDSGTTTLSLPQVSALPLCASSTQTGDSGLFCPKTNQTLTAANITDKGAAGSSISLQIGNADTLIASSNYVFNNLGSNAGTGTDTSFDWGLPFFLGRTVYVGLEGKSSTLGSGTYWSY